MTAQVQVTLFLDNEMKSLNFDKKSDIQGYFSKQQLFMRMSKLSRISQLIPVCAAKIYIQTTFLLHTANVKLLIFWFLVVCQS